MVDRLQTLNEICQKCLDERRKNFMAPPDPVTVCAGTCPTGREIHALEQGSQWESVDWNSAQFEQYYHN